MSVTSELRCRVRAERSLSRYEPCLPSPAKHPPAGSGWIHEIKHDGFRIIAEREVDRVRLMTRNGHDFSGRFPLIVATIGALPAHRRRSDCLRRAWPFRIRHDPVAAARQRRHSLRF